jgi:N-alpha-acetyltransferase 15/16, NatA auxiliary subunit
LTYPVESLPTVPSSPVGAVVSGALGSLITREMALETYNAQYLQRHSYNASAVLGAARGLQILGSPRDEIEGVAFSTLNPETDLPLKVSNVFYCSACGRLNIRCL